MQSLHVRSPSVSTLDGCVCFPYRNDLTFLAEEEEEGAVDGEGVEVVMVEGMLDEHSRVPAEDTGTAHGEVVGTTLKFTTG